MGVQWGREGGSLGGGRWGKGLPGGFPPSPTVFLLLPLFPWQFWKAEAANWKPGLTKALHRCLAVATETLCGRHVREPSCPLSKWES